MHVYFWGVRGSIPAPQLPSQIKSKISAILERVTPDDLVSEKSREKFLSELPPWLFGTVGGNSTCLSVTLDNPKELIVFDCGSGLRELGLLQAQEKVKISNYHIFLTHYHWDHLQGLPFFGPGYDPSVNLNFYSPFPELEHVIKGQMNPPYFPVTFDIMGSKKYYQRLTDSIEINNIKINYRKMNHPGDSYSYRLDDGKKIFIFSTDTELSAEDFAQTEENIKYFKGADLLVIDSQYTLGEAIEKFNWGHSAFSMAVDFGANWGIKHIVLFHHDPGYDDRKLHNILQSAKWYMERMNVKGIQLSIATEGMEIAL